MDRITTDIFSTPEICNKTFKPSISLKTIDENEKTLIAELKQHTANQEIQIAELKESNSKLQEQIDFAKSEANDAKKQCKKSSAISIVSALIALATLTYEIIINAIH